MNIDLLPLPLSVGAGEENGRDTGATLRLWLAFLIKDTFVARMYVLSCRVGLLSRRSSRLVR